MKIPTSQAYKELTECMELGFNLKDKVTSEYQSLKNSGKAADQSQKEVWTAEILEWATKTFNKLKEIYSSSVEAQKFKEAHTLPLSSYYYDDEFYGKLLLLQARLEVLDSYRSYIEKTAVVKINNYGSMIFQDGEHNRAEIKNGN